MSSAPRRTVVSVIGAGAAAAPILRVAEDLGRLLADLRCRIVTGGLGGVMEAVSRGAHDSDRYVEGTVVGLLPGIDADAANPWVDVAVPTGMGYARNVLVVSSADVVVAIGGASGTLSEIAMAWQLGKPLVALDLGEGWSARLAGTALDHKRSDPIRRATSADEAADLVAEILGLER
jgi:uncharacterized protein (TIGR00725 family)